MINNFKKKYKKYISKVLYLSFASVLSPIINLATFPIICIIYSVNDIALLALFSSTSSLLTSYGTLQYHLAIVSENSKDYKIQSLNLSILISVFFSILNTIIIYILYDFLRIDISLQMFQVVIIFSLINNLVTSFQLLQNSNGNIKTTANSRIINTILSVNLSLFLGFKKVDDGLIISIFFASLFQLFFLIFESRKDITKFDFILMKNVLIKNKHFPLYTLPQSFLESLRSNSFILITSAFYGKNELGLLSFAEKIIRTPVSIIATSSSEVLFKSLSEKFYTNKDKLYTDIKFIIPYLITFSILLISFIYLSINNIILKFFGIKWIGSIPIIKSYLILLPLWLIASPLSLIPLLTKKNKIYLFISFSMYLTSHLSFFLLSYFKYEFNFSLTIKNVIELFYLIIICHTSIRSLKPFQNEN